MDNSLTRARGVLQQMFHLWWSQSYVSCCFLQSIQADTEMENRRFRIFREDERKRHDTGRSRRAMRCRRRLTGGSRRDAPQSL